jgi:tetratricopeptide (TPR) repeat protein
MKVRSVLLIGMLLACATLALAEEKPPPLPPIELPPKPAAPAGVPHAREANRLIHAGDYQGALPLYRKAWDGGVRSERHLYNAACAAAVTGNKDEAFVWLERSAEAGHRDLDHMATDSDLDSLREDPRFAEHVERVKANIERHAREHNAELQALYEADQAQRREGRWETLQADDTARRTRVAEILKAGGATTGVDYYNAAMVYQHGGSLDAYAKAREYAARAVELGNERGRWLTAAAWDRWLRNAGYPQRFGTQYRCDKDGECVLQEWDPEVTDEERARWNVPTIEEALKRAEEM